MEMSMYEDSSYTKENVAQMKRKFTLDLNGRATKRAKSNTPFLNLTSPDLKMLKLASPEVDELLREHGGVLPSSGSFLFTGLTPNKVPTPSEYLSSFPTVSSAEFVKGFQDTFDQYRKDAPSSDAQLQCAPPAPPPTSAAHVHYTQLEVPQVPTAQDEYLPTHIKEEPHTVPASPPVSPIDMEDQEKIKLERKRLRNRIAASKCRKRKLEKISRLEDKVGQLKNENADLLTMMNKLRDQVCTLKQEVMEHVEAGCQICPSWMVQQQ